MNGLSPADAAWLKHKAKPSLLATVENLKRAHEHRYALGAPACNGGTAIVVGSGPSLSQTCHLVAGWQTAGALIITTNTGLPALAKIGVVPDVVVTREVVDVGSHLSHPAQCICVDLAAAPSVWDAAIASGAEVRWFVGAALQYFELAAKLGVRPLYGGGAALTAAVALSEEWGAARIVLLGVDLAFAPDGAGYADGSAWSGYRADLDGTHAVIGGAGYEAMREQSDRGAIPPPPQTQHTVQAPAYGGVGEVTQLLTWADQRTWLQTFATRHPFIDFRNATGAGVRIDGWAECAMTRSRSRRAWMDMGVDARVSIEDTTRALGDIRRQCVAVGALGATVADPQGCVAAVPGWLAGNALVEAVAAPDIVAQHARHLPAKQAIIEQCKALEDAAALVSKLVG